MASESLARINYKLLQDKEIEKILSSGRKPSLLLHVCCAPCATHVLDLLTVYFDITVLYYNPNIQPREEYDKRESELRRLLEITKYRNPVKQLMCGYDGLMFDSAATPLSDEPEGGSRCSLCFRIRLEQTAKLAKSGGFDYFSTTLTVSPYKNAQIINQIGSDLMSEFGITYLFSDFKKKDGYKHSIELSKRLDLYRQVYCGCRYSL